MSNIHHSQLLKYAYLHFIDIALFSMVVKEVLTSSGWILDLGSFQNIFHNLLVQRSNFSFRYIAVSYFLKIRF